MNIIFIGIVSFVLLLQAAIAGNPNVNEPVQFTPTTLKDNPYPQDNKNGNQNQNQNQNPNPNQAPATACASEIVCSDMSQIKQILYVYYSAMNPKSQLFFNTTLASIFEGIYPFVEFNYVSCQTAEIVLGQLYCPYGIDNQCQVDIVHACANALIKNKKTLQNFLACTMSGTLALPDFAKCASTVGIDFSKIEECANSDIGKRLCIDNIQEKPPGCISTPCFVFDEKDIAMADRKLVKDYYNNKDNFGALTHFEHTICGRIRAENYPSILYPPNCAKTVYIDIYYKVMDEASQKFFQALAPLYDKFAQLITVHYNACMFAENIKNELVCGEEQDKNCKAGMVHVCAAEMLSLSNPVGLFRFLACSMTDLTKPPDFDKCANENNIDLVAINDCANSDRGKYLCFESSRKRFDDSIPAITFNSVFKPALNDLAKQDVRYAVCQQLKNFNMTYPEECLGSIKLTMFFHVSDFEFQNWARVNLLTMYKLFAKFIVFDFVSCRGAMTDQTELKCSSSVDPKCQTDKLVSCAKSIVKDVSFNLVEFIYCLSQDNNGGLPAYDSCALSAQLDINALNTCANGPDGMKLCTDNFNMAPKTDKFISFQINDKFDGPVDDEILGDYVAALCKQLSLAGQSFPNKCYDLPPPPPPE